MPVPGGFGGDFLSGAGRGSFEGELPVAPAEVPPVYIEAIAALVAPPVNLGLGNIIILVAGDVGISSTLSSVTVQRR